MPDITNEDKIEFLKRHFPAPSYTILQLADLLHCSAWTVRYWMRRFEVPTFKVTGSPCVLQDNLVKFLLAADALHTDAENNIGLLFCIEDSRKKVVEGRRTSLK